MTLGQFSPEEARNVPCSLIPSLFQNPIEVHHLPVPRASGELSQEELNWAAAATSLHCAHNGRVRRFNPFRVMGATLPPAALRPRPGLGDWACSVAARVVLPGKPLHALPRLLAVASWPPAAPGASRLAQLQATQIPARPRPAPPAASAAAAATPVQPPCRGGPRQPPRPSAQPELLGKAEMETRLPRARTC